jgi:hypothetical protein
MSLDGGAVFLNYRAGRSTANQKQSDLHERDPYETSL